MLDSHSVPFYADPSMNLDGSSRTQADGYYEDLEEICPGCKESVMHPLYKTNYADDVRKIGQNLTGWHNECAKEHEQEEREAEEATKLAILGEISHILSYPILGCLPSDSELRIFALISDYAVQGVARA